jgi:hypothetical protein
MFSSDLELAGCARRRDGIPWAGAAAAHLNGFTRELTVRQISASYAMKQQYQVFMASAVLVVAMSLMVPCLAAGNATEQEPDVVSSHKLVPSTAFGFLPCVPGVSVCQSWAQLSNRVSSVLATDGFVFIQTATEQYIRRCEYEKPDSCVPFIYLNGMPSSLSQFKQGLMAKLRPGRMIVISQTQILSCSTQVRNSCKTLYRLPDVKGNLTQDCNIGEFDVYQNSIAVSDNKKYVFTSTSALLGGVALAFAVAGAVTFAALRHRDSSKKVLLSGRNIMK